VGSWPGSRIVVPGLPHHVTRRGNRREPVFFSDEAYRFADFLDRDHGDEEFTALRQREIVGRPIGDESFLASLEDRLSQTLRRKKRGPRKKAI
jgi:putative transposase